VIESRVPSEAPSRAEPLRAAFEEHYTPLLRLCVALTGKREVAEDIVQDAFVRVSPKIAGLDAPEVGPYLRRVAVNLWKSRLRRLRLERRPREVQPQANTSALEDRDEVWRALLLLPPRQRACVVLRYYEDLPERHVAEILRCSVGTVKSQTSRGLTRLRKELSA
jgi:RNA polymerase sigma-70 factor (sigma-E family)